MALRPSDLLATQADDVSRAQLSAATNTPQGGRPDPRQPRKRRIGSDLLDDELDFPDESTSRDTASEAEENWEPGDDSDLGLDDSDEDIGLDTATGLDDGQELDGDAFGSDAFDQGREDVRWTTDSEAAEDLAGTDDELLPGDEDSTTTTIGDDEPGDADDFDSGIEDETDVPADDGGIEGLEDDTELDDFDLSNLPAIEADLEEENDASRDALDELTASLSDDPMVEISAGVSWKLLPSQAQRCTTLLRFAETPGAETSDAQPKPVLAAHAGRLLLVHTNKAWLIDASAAANEAPLEALTLPLTKASEQIAHGALSEHEGQTWLALATPSTLLLSRDAGASFSREARHVEQLAFTRRAQRPRLWTLGYGKLEHSDDAAVTFTAPAALAGRTVQTFATDGDRRVSVVLAANSDDDELDDADQHALASRQLVRIARAHDGGARFSITEAAAPTPAPLNSACELGVCNNATWTCLKDRAFYAIKDASFVELFAEAGAPALLIDEDDALIAYACVSRGDSVFVVRHALREKLSKPTIFCTFDLARDGRPQLMAASYAEGFVALHVVTDRALYRIDASLDGEQLA